MSGRDDKSVLQVNAFIELSGFTPAMFDYRLGNRSALDWVVESYRVKTDARSGLVSDPNRSDDPNFISDGDRVRQQEPRRRLPARAASLVYQAVFQRRRFIYATLLKKSEVRAHVNSAKPYQTLTFALPRKGELWVTMKHSLARRAPRPLSALLVAGLLLCVPALAQPGGGPGMGGPGMGGPGMGGPGMNDQGGGRGGRGGDRSAMQAQMITRSLQSAGFTDQALITAVTTYVTDRQTARKPLFDAANALSAALTDENTTDAQMDALWSDFQAALATEKTRTATAESELDKRIGISKDSALAAALTLLGVTGDANGYLNAGQGGRGGGRGGQGGPGGPDGMGGGRGGGPGDN